MLLCRMRFTEMHVTCGSQSTLVLVDCKTLVALTPLKGCLPWWQITPTIISMLSTWRWNFRRIWNSMTVTGSVSSATGLLTKASFSLLFSYSFQIPYCLLAEKRNLSFQCPHMHLHVTGTWGFSCHQKSPSGPSQMELEWRDLLTIRYFCRYFCYLLFWLGNSLNQAPFGRAPK